MPPVNRVHVVTAAALEGVSRPLRVPPVEDHVRAEALRPDRRRLLRGDDGDVLGGCSVFGVARRAIERGPRRGARGEQDAERAVAPLQQQRVG